MNDFMSFTGYLLLAMLIGPLYVFFTEKLQMLGDWRSSNRESSHIAPDPLNTPEAIIQVYSARTFNWRGLFASHCWFAIKPAGAKHYTIYQIAGWRKYSNLSVLMIEVDQPDRYWFGNQPTMVTELRGPVAELAMARIAETSQHYPHKHDYTMWPGPNSNSYIAHVGRHVPELKLDLPSIALGKDYLIDSYLLGMSPSGTGIQISLLGIFGILVAKVEGIEINFLTQVVGISWQDGLALKWPGVGKVYLFRSIKKKLGNSSKRRDAGSFERTPCPAKQNKED